MDAAWWESGHRAHGPHTKQVPASDTWLGAGFRGYPPRRHVNGLARSRGDRGFVACPAAPEA